MCSFLISVTSSTPVNCTFNFPSRSWCHPNLITSYLGLWSHPNSILLSPWTSPKKILILRYFTFGSESFMYFFLTINSFVNLYLKIFGLYVFINKELTFYLLASYLDPCHRKRILIQRNQANNLRNASVGKALEWSYPLCCIWVVFRVTATSCSPFEN